MLMFMHWFAFPVEGESAGGALQENTHRDMVDYGTVFKHASLLFMRTHPQYYLILCIFVDLIIHPNCLC